MIQNYDPSKIFIIYGGFTIKGFAENSIVAVSRDNSSFRDVQGCDGEATRLKTRDMRGNMIFTLLQTSRSNLFLTALSLGDEILTKGVLPILVKDNNGKNLYGALEAWVLKPADSIFSGGVESREWTVRCKNLIMFSGGN